MKLFKIILCSVAFTTYGIVEAATYNVASPDGLTVFTLNDNNGKISYSVALDNVAFIEDSPLGLVTNTGDFTKGLSIMKVGEKNTKIDSYSLPNIKKAHVDYKAETCDFTIAKDGKPAIILEVEVSDNNVAYRYRLLPLENGEYSTLCCVVESEATGFRMPEGTTTFLCPQMNPMTGFARTAPSYETNYTLDDEVGKNGWGNGYVFPCLFKNGENGWTLISETGIAGNYCGAHLEGKADGLYSIAYPMEGEQNGFGSTSASIALPGCTPWRTITVGKDLAPIAETTIPFDVVEPLYESSKTYEYGKGTWSWIIKMDPSCNFDEQMRYIDFSNALGYQTVLVDALWDTQIGREGIERLAAYGKEKGVDLFLWYNSNGSWNDAPQGPRGIMNDIVKRRKDMAWMKKIGVRGIKVDFFGGDKQETMRLYHDILADANDYGIEVIFHGCTLPRGWERMYPNYVASEAVLASENLHFSQGMCDAEASNATIHPLVRNAVGSMDFGGSTLNKYYSADNSARGSQRKTSDVCALATAVLFQSPVQHFALAPNNLIDAPEWAVEFMKNVPTTWEDVKFIDGYPGRFIILARKSAGKWYIAGVNAGATLTTEIELPHGMLSDDVMAAKNKAKAVTGLTIYSDVSAPKGEVLPIGSKAPLRLNKNGKVNITIPTNGGVVIY